MSSPVPCNHFVSGRVRQASDGTPPDSVRHMPDGCLGDAAMGPVGTMVAERETREASPPLPVHGSAGLSCALASRVVPLCADPLRVRGHRWCGDSFFLFFGMAIVACLRRGGPSDGAVQGRAFGAFGGAKARAFPPSCARASVVCQSGAFRECVASPGPSVWDTRPHGGSVFGRDARRAAHGQADSWPGVVAEAFAAALGSVRGTPAGRFETGQDMANG